MKTIIFAILIAFSSSAELNTVEEEQLMWNPDGLLKCLQEAAPYSKDIIEIIELIKKRDFIKAVAKAMELIDSGSQLIKRCIEYIVGSSVELTFDWLRYADCLLPLGYG